MFLVYTFDTYLIKYSKVNVTVYKYFVTLPQPWREKDKYNPVCSVFFRILFAKGPQPTARNFICSLKLTHKIVTYTERNQALFCFQPIPTPPPKFFLKK